MENILNPAPPAPEKITHIALPPDEQARTRRLSFYLAMEEFVARELRRLDECFFLWQVNSTVIFGRNQLIENEVNLPYCRAHHIDTIRRKSGGGCVYADMNNVMFSYINTGWDITLTFDHYIHKTVQMLRSLGVDACASSRNDILINHRKVSGYAFYHIPGRNIVHGTMLYDTDMQNMVGAITPSDQKLVSKGVESVRQHICLLKDYIGRRMDVNQFKDYTRRYLCNDEYTLTHADVARIEEIQKEYHDPAYIYGHNPAYTTRRHVRIDGVGEFEVALDIKGSKIRGLNIMGDFFLTGDLNTMISRLKGAPYTRRALEHIVRGLDVEHTIMGLTPDGLLNILIDQSN